VLHHAIPLQNLVEHMERAPAIYHEVFRDDFKPVNNRLLIKDVIVMRDAQANAYTIVCVPVKAIRRHGKPVKLESLNLRWKKMEDRSL